MNQDLRTLGRIGIGFCASVGALVVGTCIAAAISATHEREKERDALKRVNAEYRETISRFEQLERVRRAQDAEKATTE